MIWYYIIYYVINLEGGMIWLEALVELQFIKSSFSNSNLSIRAFRAYPLIELRHAVPGQGIRGKSSDSRQHYLSQQYPPPLLSLTVAGWGGRALQFVLVPPNLDGFMTVHEIVGRELDWLRRWFILVAPNLLGGSNLFTASQSSPVASGFAFWRSRNWFWRSQRTCYEPIIFIRVILPCYYDYYYYYYYC